MISVNRFCWVNSLREDVQDLALPIDLARYSRKGLVFAKVEAGLIRRRRELAAI